MFDHSVAPDNLHKGTSWREFTVEDAKRALEKELREVLGAEAAEDIMSECADLANRAMHLWDVAKRLKAEK